MDVIENILNTFQPITLEEMDSVRLMNRTDTKYLFNYRHLADILEQLTEDFYVLDVDGVKINPYETVYYDTDDFYFYHQHQRGKMNRFKVRLRTYVTSNIHFFEIKHKNNKNRTLKVRIKRKEPKLDLGEKSSAFVESKINMLATSLSPKLWANYSRITLVNKHQPERLTIDTQLFYKNNTSEKAFPEIVIAELKQDKNSKSAFSQLMHKLHISNTSISKYCFGVLFLYENVRINNFKPKLLTFNKICNDTL